MSDVPEMVERVARAMFESTRTHTHVGEIWDSRIAETQDWYRGTARAAIAAMREPTEAMIEAAYSFSSPIKAEGAEIGSIRQRHEPADAWRAMIDQALTDSPCPSASEARPPTSEP